MVSGRPKRRKNWTWFQKVPRSRMSAHAHCRSVHLVFSQSRGEQEERPGRGSGEDCGGRLRNDGAPQKKKKELHCMWLIRAANLRAEERKQFGGSKGGCCWVGRLEKEERKRGELRGRSRPLDRQRSLHKQKENITLNNKGGSEGGGSRRAGDEITVLKGPRIF